MGGLIDLGDVMICQKKSLRECCIMGRRIVVMKLVCSLRHFECDGNTVHRLSQLRLTADLLAPTGECSRMHSKVSSERLPSNNKATGPVLEIFKMAGYFPDSPRRSTVQYLPPVTLLAPRILGCFPDFRIICAPLKEKIM